MKKQEEDEIERWKELFRKENTSEIERLYDLYRGTFVRMATKYYKVDESVMVDIFQQSFIAFYENLVSGKISYQTANMQTYIFKIGMNKLYTYTYRKKDVGLIDDVAHMVGEEDDIQDEKALEIINRMIENMGEPCKKVLSLYYHQNNSMKEIACKMNYAGEQVAKNRKKLCFKTLRENALKKLRIAGLI